ncbi:Binding-protein-dependent transport system inner membrane component [Acididesulfobacillus acetoxydans]|uniref:Binding-protein-dependent transport system inner membrane component n=1 Tax=Acididesulfobacillus acetoxydans TaxID=1561005 RepID=A0A8S0W7R0_9FIRM|nr:ABC transporter permease [Acididesulfobacillus acetoxydans]CAA7601039.1 Binding-protein-dependent transport system inner membrane component [Acididesulfobacillus acetoxydans]CEJ06913.1 Carnitine transport permease protein OpuCB [Acididesulfobacillus acetoxydans]
MGYAQLELCTWQTVEQVTVTLLLAIIVGVLLGLISYKVKPLEKPILILTNIIQTTPAFAVLVLSVPFLGVGFKPAILAMLIVCIMPIFRNTFVGLKNIKTGIIETSVGMGMTGWQCIYKVEFPLAIPVIMAGIKTSAVICVGISVLASYIGAGGLGYFIRYGLSLNDVKVLLMGAVPSSLLAIMLDVLLGRAERALRVRFFGT